MNRVFGLFAMIVLAFGLAASAAARPTPKRDSGTRLTASASSAVPSKQNHRTHRRHHHRRRSMHHRASLKNEKERSRPNTQK